ncbi:rhamnosyltransferase, partial [Escherichia coli]|nr:rhamnosyltransferase [Escherichia coli]
MTGRPATVAGAFAGPFTGARPVPDPRPGRLVLGITLFRPRPDQLARVRALASAGYAAVIAFDNGGLPAGAADQLARSGVTLLSEGANL